MNLRCSRISCSNTEEGVNEFALPDRVTFRQPPNLSFSNHMHRFITFDRPPSRFDRPETQAGCNPFLSSTRQDPLERRSSRRTRRFKIGAYRCTQRQMVE